jgi:hypothetical protein
LVVPGEHQVAAVVGVLKPTLAGGISALLELAISGGGSSGGSAGRGNALNEGHAGRQ